MRWVAGVPETRKTRAGAAGRNVGLLFRPLCQGAGVAGRCPLAWGVVAIWVGACMRPQPSLLRSISTTGPGPLVARGGCISLPLVCAPMCWNEAGLASSLGPLGFKRWECQPRFSSSGLPAGWRRALCRKHRTYTQIQISNEVIITVECSLFQQAFFQNLFADLYRAPGTAGGWPRRGCCADVA